MNLAIITARGGSKRIPRKNIRPFCGQPIVTYSIKAAIEAGCFDEVMISTDDQEIAEIAVGAGAVCPFLRSEKNSDDHASTADVIKEVLNEYKTNQGKDVKNACCIYPTAPFITAEVLKEAFNLLMSEEATKTVFPVTSFSYPIQRALKMNNARVEMFQPEHMFSRSQDLEPAYHDAGQFYWFKTEPFLKDSKLFTNQSKAITLPETRVQDIDNESDWVIAELKFQLLQKELGL